MSDIVNTYPVFERNQVLTSTQLNNLVNYLDQQNRLTRARLIGMGVVCGLELSYNPVENTLTISKGTGITSEGYLINIGECINVKYRPYTLPPGTIYEPFVDSANKQDISLFELLTESAKDSPDDKTLEDETFLADKVVLLFIESFDKDLKSCLGKSCDELGKERILTLRKLLISKTDLEKVWDRTNTGKLDAIFPEKFNLPVVNLPRVLFSPKTPSSTNYTDFSKNYANAVLSVFDKLIGAFSETYDIYRPLLIKSYGEKNPFETTTVVNKLAKIQNFLNNSDATLTSYLGVQYVYDLFQDLILAYNEFKNAAFDLMSECCADMSRFPKHLMLGEAIPPTSNGCQNSEYRHHFIQPPIYNLQKLLVQETISLHNRIVLMIESFDLKRINGFKGADGKSFPVKITPSLEKTTQLSQRSIPWYYDLKKKSSFAALATLKTYWNFNVTRKCIAETEGLVLDYDDQSSDQTVMKNKLATPLYYDIQNYSFLRIEGQIGAVLDAAVKDISNLKTRFNLPFNMVTLQLDVKAELLQLDYKCGFEDLQEEYRFLKLSFCRFAGDIRDIFSFIMENSETLLNTGEKGEEQSALLKKIEQIVEITVKLCESMPDCISKFNFNEFQKLYKLLLDVSISFVLIDLKLLEKINIAAKDAEKQVPLINGFIQRISPIVNKLVDLLFYNRFLRLYYSFKRREFYLKKTTGIFSNYLIKNPGVEHQAGVQKGGTFILIYENTEKSIVIADFSLPYLCCTTENCVPMCDEDSGFVFEVNPFARPDYAITLINTPVKIDVLRNDTGLLGEDIVFKPITETTEFGGNVFFDPDSNVLEYMPAKGFTGTDSFEYGLFNIKTGAEDKAKVTIVVKKAEQEKTCYTVEILQCWGDEAVKDAVSQRKLAMTSGASMFEVLLTDLRKTGGFTQNEIFSSILEKIERKQGLLKCLGIDFSADTSNDQLGQLILNYQNSNCGVVQPVKECYSVAILQCWGDDAVKETIERRKISLTGAAGMYEALLNDLRKTGGFMEEEILSTVLEDEERRRSLLGCVGISVSPNTTYQELGNLILEYQKSNCGSVQPAKECYTAAVLQCWGDSNVHAILKNRGIQATGDIFQLLLQSLRQTFGFTSKELQEMNEQVILQLLKCLQITVPANKKPIEALIEYQSQNCQSAVANPKVKVDTGALPVAELVKILEKRGVAANVTESKENLEKAVNSSSSGNELTEDEISTLSDNSIVNILVNKNITHSATENKSQLIKKLFNRG